MNEINSESIQETYIDTRLPEISGDIIFLHNNGENEILKICANGKFYVKGKEVIEDIKVYEAMVEFLKQAGFYS